MTRSCWLLLILSACSTAPIHYPTDASMVPDSAPSDAGVPYTRHFIVNAWAFGDTIDLSLDGAEPRPFEVITDIRGPHTVTFHRRSGMGGPYEVRLYCDGVGVESGPHLPPPEVSGTFELAAMTLTLECP